MSSNFSTLAGNPLPENHHLEFRKDRGTWRFKAAIVFDRKFIGKRIVIDLGIRDEITARMIRDKFLKAFNDAGLLSRRVLEPSVGDDFHPSTTTQSNR